MRAEIDDTPYPDAWAFTFVGMIDPAEAGRLYRLHVDVRFEYQLVQMQRELDVLVRQAGW